jgi:hypothetical protein
MNEKLHCQNLNETAAEIKSKVRGKHHIWQELVSFVSTCSDV